MFLMDVSIRTPFLAPGLALAAKLALVAGLAAPGASAGQSVFADGFECLRFLDADGDGFGSPLSSIVSCAPTAGYVANHGDCNDGNPAVKPGATDIPDAQFLDRNCDGIDGDIALAAFVAPAGVDNAMCRIAAPCATIAHAIATVVADVSRDQVYVRAGTYNETVTLAAGTSVFGGYNSAWVAADRSAPAHLSKIRGGVRANLFNLAAVGMPAVANLVVESVPAAAPGQSSIAVLLTNSPNVAFDRVNISAAAGAPGIDRSTAATGGTGLIGGQGRPGCENSSFPCTTCDQPAGGLMGASACGRTGGVGGIPGLSEGSGGGGGTGLIGTLGGQGAPCESCSGVVGGTGAPGGPGSNGIGGATMGLFAAGAYVPTAGSDGSTGQHGNGGGGGGGGGGGTTDCDSYGSSGGGGGGGGCGGGPGLGGGGGGGSFAVVLLDSNATFGNGVIASGNGGTGGDGGSGGDGGTGGDPGPGGIYGGNDEQDDGGFGAPGGRGGNGGRGGDGGGGGGGPSIAIHCVGASTAAFATSTLAPGTGGQGGASAASSGNAGVSAATVGCGS